MFACVNLCAPVREHVGWVGGWVIEHASKSCLLPAPHVTKGKFSAHAPKKEAISCPIGSKRKQLLAEAAELTKYVPRLEIPKPDLSVCTTTQSSVLAPVCIKASDRVSVAVKLREDRAVNKVPKQNCRVDAAAQRSLAIPVDGQGQNPVRVALEQTCYVND